MPLSLSPDAFIIIYTPGYETLTLDPSNTHALMMHMRGLAGIIPTVTPDTSSNVDGATQTLLAQMTPTERNALLVSRLGFVWGRMVAWGVKRYLRPATPSP